MNKIKEKIYGRIKLTSDDGRIIHVRPKYPAKLIEVYEKVTKKKIPMDKIIRPFVDPDIPSELVAQEMKKRAKDKMV